MRTNLCLLEDKIERKLNQFGFQCSMADTCKAVQLWYKNLYLKVDKQR